MTPLMDYRYLASSALRSRADGAELDLATSGGLGLDGQPQAHPYFFSGFVAQPGVVAGSLLTLARIARTRFYVPPNTLAAVLRAADPVVTSTTEGLRFESFSVCCGVYARLDVQRSALHAEHIAVGVTNVDINPPLRQALAGLRPSDPLYLTVGHDELRVATPGSELVEEKVPLPGRWLKGFAETQLLAAGMRLRHELDTVGARLFIQSLPKNSATKTVMWATRAMQSLRLASRPTAGAVCVAGPERLRALEPLLRFATGLRVYGPEVDASSLPCTSAWVLELPGARLTILLSPEKARGFSGEGGVLVGLAGATVTEDAEVLAALLAFEPCIDPARLAANAGITTARVIDALGALASSGQVGFDLADGAYFHRPLPLSLDALEAMHPRLADAQKLAASGAVTSTEQGVYDVRSGDITYRVRLTANGEERCTCPWFAKYRGTRGPCKHALAVRIVTRSDVPGVVH